MSISHVTTQDTIKTTPGNRGTGRKRRIWIFILTGVLVVAVALSVTLKIATAAPAPSEPVEAARVLAAQDSMQDFGILIPGYLPKAFDRSKAEVQTGQIGPGGQPTADLVYRAKNGAAVFIHQWVPVHPELEVLNGSRIIQTKWGKSYLLTQGTTDGLANLWVDIGPLRVSLVSTDMKTASREQLVLSAETLGLASNNQAFFVTPELPAITDLAPPPPFEVAVNSEGIQELNLTITPGGFVPIRFAVTKGVPLKINYRALGEVGCGNVAMIPTEGQNYAALEVSRAQLSDSVTFTPDQSGDFRFFCSSDHYRGIMTVREPAQK